jgi:hypothetical protein
MVKICRCIFAPHIVQVANGLCDGTYRRAFATETPSGELLLRPDAQSSSGVVQANIRDN